MTAPGVRAEHRAPFFEVDQLADGTFTITLGDRAGGYGQYSGMTFRGLVRLWSQFLDLLAEVDEAKTKARKELER